VIRSFADAATEDLFNGVDSRQARNACPQALWPVVTRKLDQETGYANDVEVTDYH
jgi:proteic killer suppression protein